MGENAVPLFPRIGGACPYERDLDAVIAGDWCRMCRRQVIDLTEMGDAEKQRLFANCGDDVPCVRYRLPAAIAAAALAVTAGQVAAADRHHARHHPHAKPPAIAPLMIPTAGVPVMPVQWHDEAPKTVPDAKAPPPDLSRPSAPRADGTT